MSRFALPLAGSRITAQSLANLAGEFLFNVQNPAYGAIGDGAHDDTASIQAAVTAAQSTPGNVLYFPPGEYAISSPIVFTQSGLAVIAGGPGGTQGGGGSGSGTFTPGTPGTITGTLKPGATISPTSSFAKGSANVSACFLVDGTINGEVDRVHIDGFTFYGANAGTTNIHCVATYGKANAFKLSDCHGLVFYGTGSDGFHITEDGSGNDADGTYLERCLFQFIGNDGIHGPFGDGTIVDCHTQIVGGYGYYISDAVGYTGGSGGNVRLLNCRGDLSALDGFFINVSAGGYSGMIQVDNCSTQRNTNNGFHVAAVASTETCTVNFSNCVAQGDGTDALSAGWRFNGPVTVSCKNCNTNMTNGVDHSDKFPYTAIRTASATQNPLLVTMVGGFHNSKTAFSDTSGGAPTNQTIDTWSLITNQLTYNQGANFVHKTTL